MRYPTDSGLAADGVRALAREARKLAAKIGASARRIGIAGAAGRRVRGITRTMRHRSAGEAGGTQADRADRRAAGPLGQGGAPARRGGAASGSGARRPGQAQGRPQARAARRPVREGCPADQTAHRRREDHRPAGVAVGPGRAADPQGQAIDAQPVRVCRSAVRDHRQHQAWCARVTCRPKARAATRPGHAAPVHRSQAGQARDQVAGGDGAVQRDADQHRARGPGRRGAHHRPPGTRLPAHPPPPTALPHGCRGRVSHLKRGYGLRRSRLKGDEGHQIWDGWAALTYNADTYTTLP